MLLKLVHFFSEAPAVPCLLLQTLVETALIKTVSPDWAGAEGSAWSSPAPAAATSHIAIRGIVLLMQRLIKRLASFLEYLLLLIHNTDRCGYG